MREIRIGDTVEMAVERADYPSAKIQQILGAETVAVLGYGVQGRGQSLNMKDNGVNVIIGMREQGKGWQLAQQDGWTPGKTLFPLEEAARVLHAKEVGPGKWVALCPVHDNHSPSLSIMRGDRQALVLKCWACRAPFEELLLAIGARRAGVRR